MNHYFSERSFKTWIILIAIILFGFVLRIYKLDAYSIFFDEKSTMVISQGIVLEGANQKEVYSKPVVFIPEFWKSPELDYKPKSVLRSFTYQIKYLPKTFTPKEFWAKKGLEDYYEAMNRSDIGNSSFYYLLLHYWLDAFGLSDFSARFFSLLFSVFIIGIMFLFGRRFFGTNIGLISAALVSVEPFFIAYSHQARNYSLTFGLTLLATYFFLQIIENNTANRKTLGLYLGYIITAGLGLLSHFLVILVLMVHGLYALFFLRNLRTWIRMSIAAPLALAGVTWWLMFGGGQYTIYTLNYQADLYKRMAETRPLDNPFGALPATFDNVLNKSLPLFGDLIMFTNGMTGILVGKKNIIISILVGLLLILWYRYSKRNELLISKKPFLNYVPWVIMGGSLLVYSQTKIQFGVFSVAVFGLSFIYDLYKSADPIVRKRYWLLYFMGFIPSILLVLMAINNGHTTGITQRYSGFSFPFVIILISLLLQYYTKLKPSFKYLIYFFLSFQCYYIGLRLMEFYNDRSVKYGYFAEPREPNPYWYAAKKIIALYQPGDTIYYPASKMEILSEMDRTFLPYSIQDAQLTNLYLPKNATFVQVMDSTQNESILLKQKNKLEPLVIKRLKGLRYGSE